MSRFFILRPIFAAVISIVITLAGLVAAFVLPIAQYPEIAPPTVTITATYPGASAETLASTVAAPIEEQLSGIEHLAYYNSSSSSNGTMSITVTFDVGSDGDQATIDVNNRVRIATPRLPQEVQRTGVTVLKKSNDILMVVSMLTDGKQTDTLTLSNWALVNLSDELKRIQGVGDVTIFGARDYSMRIWLDVPKMARLGITPADVQAAVTAQNAQYAAGKIGAEPAPAGQQLVFTVTTRGRLAEVDDFADIVLRANGPTGVLRLKDVARVELDAQSFDTQSTTDGQPSIAMGVFLQAGANALQVSKDVRAKMAEFQPRFPPGVRWMVPFDTTSFINASIGEVVHTVVEAAVLVVAVVFIFLQSWRATLIPAIAVPVSLIGAFAGLLAFGFSINTLTLFAMVLVIGIVVDDAIVVLENVERLMNEQNMSPMQASLEAMREVQGAVVGIVLVLAAVFIPVAFLGGIAGQLYRQFAMTVTISVVISGLVALTLTPALCAILLKPGKHGESKLFRPFNRGFEKLTDGYVALVGAALRHRWLALAIFAGVIAGAGFMFTRVPGGFVPAEDQGYLISSVQLPDAATLPRTLRAGEQFQQGFAENDAVAHRIFIAGFDLLSGSNKTNAATMFSTLAPWDDRKRDAAGLVADLMPGGFRLPDGIGFSFNPPAIRGIGTAGGFEVYVQSRSGGSPAQLSAAVNGFIAELSKDPRLTNVKTFFRPTTPQLRVDVDRAKAITLGVPVADVFSALQATMGALYVNDFNRNGRTFRVQIQADAPYRAQPDDLGEVYVRSAGGDMIPVKALVTVRSVIGAEQLERFNGFVAAKIMGDGKPGVSSSQAIAAVQETAARALPADYQIQWTGQAYQQLRTGNSSAYAFGLALVMVYLILAALYERWGMPVAVLLAVPFALMGALGFVLIRAMQNDIYFQIGLIVLIGLAAKNAILIVEFALQGLDEGRSAVDAALHAARLRFRPIVMTSLAFVLGVLPLVIATGAGAAARQSMGTGVFGGMIVATFVAPIFIPLFFVLLAGKKRPKHLDPLPAGHAGDSHV
ncbi:efflux RND transporter permease subunit [Derxia lacustris]|uniref:efflux RND transporter permease subunit n=1 Tax=Derxia lacustris TaxID=764842 RepID=UPI000A16FFC7|nr:multidrug efflux RND transporter permease subunit [Derxia lacustris]